MRDVVCCQQEEGFGLRAPQETINRETASLLAIAAQFGVDTAKNIIRMPLESNIFSEAGRLGFNHEHLALATAAYVDDGAACEAMSRYLRAWDLGLQRVELTPMQVQDSSGEEKTVYRAEGVHSDGKQEVALSLSSES